MKDKIIKNIPNGITVSRMIASIIAPILFLTGTYGLSVGFYVYAAVSDFLDGHFAKKLNAFSELGRKLDAFSDKIFALSLSLPAILSGNLLMFIPLSLETVIGLHNYKKEKRGQKVYTNRIGKFKTAALFPTMILGLISSIVPIVNIAFIPSLFISTNLQLKTYKAYQKDSEDELDQLSADVKIESAMGVEHEDIPIKEKIETLRKEMAFYLGLKEEKQENKKTKERKK